MSISPVSEIPSTQRLIELTGACFSANSRSDTVSRLCNSNTGDYWQSSASCPHIVTITLPQLSSIDTVWMYGNSSDASYQPCDLRVQLKGNSGTELLSKTFSITQSTGWFGLEMDHRPMNVQKVVFSITRNHRGGCDTRVRLISISKLSGGNIIFSPQKVRSRLQLDVLSLLPSPLRPTNPGLLSFKDIPTDVNVVCEDVMYPAHMFILASRWKNLEKLFDEETMVVDLSSFPSSHVCQLLWYTYSGKAKKIFGLFKAGFASSETVAFGGKISIPEVVMEIAEIACEVGCQGLQSICDSIIASKILATPECVTGKLIKSLQERKSAVLEDALFSILEDDKEMAKKYLPYLSKDLIRRFVQSSIAGHAASGPFTLSSLLPIASGGSTQTVTIGSLLYHVLPRAPALGDRVCIKRDVKEPEFGMQEATHEMVGVIVDEEKETNSVFIRFGPDIPRWKGLISEIHVVWGGSSEDDEWSREEDAVCYDIQV
ncbi:hypothetical protein ADUPG1_013052 [Aduncisulcus paluster]|uniref:BTB domain-containing protein n=1 Tax=Aduncisulcus paluster TaxID=2918883 RepID=A0ABQ5K585_9EUKA|nr:hypothetical protein ADUPG1_013052 [Aduncisulcus paluster]|eukprot:gnl/Carplike_NY0171/983_a1351_1776.p1 GENE.gnl/Carplike_NY0171/983_a1351_1776~~gnl/Carplike_NY0171/983_a1351_1776.p1  ORF type:complete len:487 (-),score=152.06 gnl/Carplike_NY0171/983_a1351_1776:77-1537(-)